MTPGPSLQDMITTVRADAASEDPLEQLSVAARTAAELEEVADAALSHFVDQCRRSGRSWTQISKALGVTKQAAHKRFSPAVSLERFTARARALLEHSVAEAVRLRHHYVGTEHVLLGLMADAESLASKVLAETSITRGIVEERVLQVTPRGSIAVDAPPFTPRASRCIENALSEALQLGHNYIGTEHILLALFDDPEGLAAKILAQLGATDDDVRAAVIKQLSGYVS
jgi:hypothetical protein